MFEQIKSKQSSIGIIGLGYVGLPLALEFAKKYKVLGFDINADRISMMRRHIDPSNELDTTAFEHSDIEFSDHLDDLKKCTVYIVAVPTDIDENKVPNLKPLLSASATVGQVIKPGDYVIFESTVYPGCTEDDCIPIIENLSGLTFGKDFKAGYSPERINPGDKSRTLTSILKIVSGSDPEALENISSLYGSIITAGLYRAESIKVAEAAKVIENTQRDLNISLMNELSIIFDQMDIDTHEVIEAAATKWNFIKLYPGLVGGHCIGVDPYYLLHKAKELGIDPQVIASGRRINDGMPAHIAKKLVQKLIAHRKNPGEARVLIMGVTFKENVSDIRNSKVVDLIRELKDYSIRVDIADPNVNAEEFNHEYGLKILSQVNGPYDAGIIAVAHQDFKSLDKTYFDQILTGDHPILFDLKGIYYNLKDQYDYWRL